MRFRFVKLMVLVGALVAALVVPAGAPPASAVDASPTAGGLTINVDIPYPAFPCNFTAVPNPCWADVSGAMGGAVSGVDVTDDGNVPWAVEFRADVSASIPYLTLWLLTYPFPTGWCNYENSRGQASATSVAASGTYGTTPVVGVSLAGELGYLRVGTDTAGIAFDHLAITLTLEGGSQVTVSAGRFAGGAGTWTVVDGSIPSDCVSGSVPPDGPPMTARLYGALAAGATVEGLSA